MSLTESCLALAIASTVTAIAAPSILRFRETYVLNAAAHDVATKLYTARIHAITQDQDCRLRVSSTTSYLIECGNAPWVVVDRVELSRGLTVTANARPEFHRRGNVSPTATISVWTASGRVKRIVINVNGRVRMQ